MNAINCIPFDPLKDEAPFGADPPRKPRLGEGLWDRVRRYIPWG